MQNTRITTILLIVIASALLAQLLPTPVKPSNLFGGGSSVDTYSFATATSTNIGTAAVLVLAQNASRKYFSIQNQSLVPIWCAFEGTTTSTNSVVSSTSAAREGKGILINASGTVNSLYENRGYIGTVNCAAPSNTTATITVGF